MKSLVKLELQQTQGRDYQEVEDMFDALLAAHPLTDAEEQAFIAEVTAENCEGPIHHKLYALQDKATKVVARRDNWCTSCRNVETGLMLDYIIEEAADD